VQNLTQRHWKYRHSIKRITISLFCTFVSYSEILVENSRFNRNVLTEILFSTFHRQTDGWTHHNSIFRASIELCGKSSKVDDQSQWKGQNLTPFDPNPSTDRHQKLHRWLRCGQLPFSKFLHIRNVEKYYFPFLVLMNAKTQTNQQNLKGKSAQTYKVN